MLCFGDLELQEKPTLLVTALSDTRMEVLQDLVPPLELGIPQMQLDPFPRLEKPVRKASRGGTPIPILSKDITAREGSSR